MTQNDIIAKDSNAKQKHELASKDNFIKEQHNASFQDKTGKEELQIKYHEKYSLKSTFQKTQVELDRISNLSIFDEQDLEKGLKFNSIDVQDSIFFKIYIGSTLYFACAYNHIIDERTFSKNQYPALHFSKCQEIQTINPDHLKICIPKINSFDYRVRSNGIDTRLFYEHPLRICPFCIINLCKVLEKKYKKEILPNSINHEEILSSIFKNTLKNIVL